MIIFWFWCIIVVFEEVFFGLVCCYFEGWGVGFVGVEGLGGRF